MGSRDQFAEMAERLAALQGRFILSINDRQEVRHIFSGFDLDATSTTYTIAKGDASKAGELIVTGGSKGV